MKSAHERKEFLKMPYEMSCDNGFRFAAATGSEMIPATAWSFFKKLTDPKARRLISKI